MQLYLYKLFVTIVAINPGTLSAATSCSKRSNVDYGNENEDTPKPASP